MKKFEGGGKEKWNNELVFVNDFFQKECEDNEVFEIDGEDDCNENRITLAYRCIKNNKYYYNKTVLPPDLLVNLSDNIVLSILKEYIVLIREGSKQE